ncbi:hypothetical protein L873DRAFT_347661 [Choiromyces venosus 120613-1]|uniref:Uncharacterized protein n=1 Tax=Choiromyces venosus 120613-1 TaxID=1336337 RepID=A0A3N4JBC5_9PEZI|nr:hypothetical protein L873DRAFT_347661 [Choiromyces venosus 120613-1]
MNKRPRVSIPGLVWSSFRKMSNSDLPELPTPGNPTSHPSPHTNVSFSAHPLRQLRWEEKKKKFNSLIAGIIHLPIYPSTQLIYLTHSLLLLLPFLPRSLPVNVDFFLHYLFQHARSGTFLYRS